VTDATCFYDKHSLRLLVLYGTNKGDLEWKLSYYSDGCGNSEHVYPCISLEEAQQRVNTIVKERLESGQIIDYKNLPEGTHMTPELQIYIAKEKEQDKKKRQQKITNLQKQIEELK
jgi:hypothetical protein